ncbi:hypothetical protein SB659_20115, partial [Arthrobacter sp. SIMBA_036]|uniref:hypothetical protein n=1 Tax=Arthrobacter sp. SIMBA_036 TaxID=3085778 RepID=UPI003978924C
VRSNHPSALAPDVSDFGTIAAMPASSHALVYDGVKIRTELSVAHGEFLLAATAQNLQLQQIVEGQAHAREEQTRTGRAAAHPG